MKYGIYVIVLNISIINVLDKYVGDLVGVMFEVLGL